jgi:hypothetical protein
MVFETRKKEQVEMSKPTFARWLCLMEAFYIIEKKAEDLELELNDDAIVKPLAFEKYIDQRFEGMMLDLDHDERNNLVGRNYVKFDSEPEQELVISTVS